MLLDDLLNKTTPSPTSPVQSRSNSAASSPISLSQNSTNCSSPQQFLESWLKLGDRSNSNSRNAPKTSPSLGNPNGENSSCNKRRRETEDSLNTKKRVCLDSEEQESGEDSSSAQCEASCGKELSKVEKNSYFYKGTNKENVDINLNSRLNSGQSPVNTELAKLSERQSKTKPRDSSSKQIAESGKDAILKEATNQSECKNVMTKEATNQSECKDAVTKLNGKKSNWLRDMGVKKKSLSKISRKVKPPSQPSSPQLQEPSSPNTDLRLILKNTRSIRDYFVPVSSDEDSPSKSCLR